MLLLNTSKQMQSWSLSQKRKGKTIAFVPTMGALHEGHLALVDEARKHCDLVVMSIYVNPAQFGPEEDLGKYPRDTERDLALAKGRRTDAVFLPANEEIYPAGYQTFINVEEVAKPLCGASRPGHFRGVATVVAKLFNIILPNVAIFGEKDFQQLVVIKRMVKDLNFPIEIIGHPIVREKDGLAMSSRNRYLSDVEHAAALSIFKSLCEAEAMVKNGEKDAAKIISKVISTIEANGIMRIDYVNVVDPETLADVGEVAKPALLAIAAFAGKTRLIDNGLLGI